MPEGRHQLNHRRGSLRNYPALSRRIFDSKDTVPDPHAYVSRLQTTMQLLHPTPTSHHAKRRTLISKDLNSCTHIFIRKDAICKSLQPPYDRPFEVINCTLKFFTVTVNGNPQNISLDRLNRHILNRHQGHPRQVLPHP